ncbi:MAG: hypothetical protein ACM3SP_15420 [Chloroflexota bacterium]
MYSVFHIVTFFCFVVFILWHASLATVLFVVGTVNILGTIYNTIWYHRFCSHASMKLRRDQYTKFFLWSNPLLLREECYAIPHRIHHQRAEKPGDPYGPHLGWLGSYLAAESSQKINTSISEKEYNSLIQSLKHIPIPVNSYEDFLKTASVENPLHYFLRTLLSQVLWALVIFVVGGHSYLLAWYSAIFSTTFLMRDFNWRGHGGNFRHHKIKGWEFDTKTFALNQRFYGYLAGEWHDNHHKYPFSANNGFLPGQIDIAFQIVKLLHRLGIVESYVDAKPQFEKECLGISSGKALVVGK